MRSFNESKEKKKHKRNEKKIKILIQYQYIIRMRFWACRSARIDEKKTVATVDEVIYLKFKHSQKHQNQMDLVVV